MTQTHARITGDIEIPLKTHAGFIHFVPARRTGRTRYVRPSALHEAIRQDIPLHAFDPEMDQKRNHDFRMLYDLGEAIKSDEQLYHRVYQPKISLHTGTTVGVEALLRWEHPVLGNIPPATLVRRTHQPDGGADAVGCGQGH
ncbi:hypothetical protein CWS02_16090 [Enterobacter sp. EA-1]|nr:hypothetical protein CWS02_16090 [Enterobacter sp. EA-1]